MSWRRRQAAAFRDLRHQSGPRSRGTTYEPDGFRDPGISLAVPSFSNSPCVKVSTGALRRGPGLPQQRRGIPARPGSAVDAPTFVRQYRTLTSRTSLPAPVTYPAPTKNASNAPKSDEKTRHRFCNFTSVKSTRLARPRSHAIQITLWCDVTCGATRNDAAKSGRSLSGANATPC